MDNKILAAVSEFGGKWPDKAATVLVYEKGVDICYCKLISEYSVTENEFKVAAEEWLKEAYMHNAALNCDWDIEKRDSDVLMVVSNNTVCHWGFDICTEQEFIDYCRKNKPHVPKLSFNCSCHIVELSSESLIKNTVEWLVNADSQDQRDKALQHLLDMLPPLPTPREKAIDAMCNVVESHSNYKNMNVNIDCSVAIKFTIETLYDAGYRKL